MALSQTPEGRKKRNIPIPGQRIGRTVMAVWLRACAISYLPNHARMYEHHTQQRALTMMAVVIRFV